MFDTSGDILNLVLAVSIAVFTGFLCWLLYSVTSSIRKVLNILDEVNKLVKAIEDKVERAEKIFTAVEEKLKSFSSFLPLIMSGVNKVLDYVKSRKNSSRKKTDSQRR